MKKFCLFFVFVLAVSLACAGGNTAASAPFVVHGATPDSGLRPAEGYDAVLALEVVYSEGTQIAETWVNSYWKMNESPDQVLTTPSEVIANLKLRDVNDVEAKFAPGAQDDIPNGKPEEYEALKISVSNGWTCDRRDDLLVWDCKGP